MTAARSTARVATERAARYGKQLVSHLGRRNGGEWNDDGTGTIVFGSGQADLSSSDDALLIVVEGDDLDNLEDVVARHLVRFGTQDELVVTWEREGDSA